MATSPFIDTIDQLVAKIIENGFTLIFDTSFLIWSACFIVLMAYGLSQIYNNSFKHSSNPLRTIQFPRYLIVFVASLIMVISVAFGFPLGVSYGTHIPAILDLIAATEALQ